MWEKEKLLVTNNFFFSHCVFNRLVFQGRQKVSLCGNGLSDTLSLLSFGNGGHILRKSHSQSRKMEKGLEKALWKAQRWSYPVLIQDFGEPPLVDIILFLLISLVHAFVVQSKQEPGLDRFTRQTSKHINPFPNNSSKLKGFADDYFKSEKSVARACFGKG